MGIECSAVNLKFTDMYMLNYKANCKELKAKLKKQYKSITMEDLRCSNGGKEEMLKKLQYKLGKTNEELCEIILNL